MHNTSRPADSEPTGFVDKTGQPIFVGDVLQLRLGLNLKHGGPTTYKVTKAGKRYRLASLTSDNPYDGFKISQQNCNIAVIIDHAH